MQWSECEKKCSERREEKRRRPARAPPPWWEAQRVLPIALDAGAGTDRHRLTIFQVRVYMSVCKRIAHLVYVSPGECQFALLHHIPG